MRLRQTVVTLAALLFTSAGIYLLFIGFMRSAVHTLLSVRNACVDTVGKQSENPHKILFISCGGYL